MVGRYRVWLEPSAHRLERWDRGDADAPSDGPYRERFAEICHSLNQAGVAYSTTFDSEGGRDYALIETTHG